MSAIPAKLAAAVTERMPLTPTAMITLAVLSVLASAFILPAVKMILAM